MNLERGCIHPGIGRKNIFEVILWENVAVFSQKILDKPLTRFWLGIQKGQLVGNYVLLVQIFRSSSLLKIGITNIWFLLFIILTFLIIYYCSHFSSIYRIEISFILLSI